MAVLWMADEALAAMAERRLAIYGYDSGGIDGGSCVCVETAMDGGYGGGNGWLLWLRPLMAVAVAIDGYGCDGCGN